MIQVSIQRIDNGYIVDENDDRSADRAACDGGQYYYKTFDAAIKSAANFLRTRVDEKGD